MDEKFDKYLTEAGTTGGNYPNSGGISSDDDLPPGATVYGEKMVPVEMDSLSGKLKRWVSDPNFTWDEFENSIGMEDKDNYHVSLTGLNKTVKRDGFDVTNHTKHVSPDDKVDHPEEGGGQDDIIDSDVVKPYIQLGSDKEEFMTVESLVEKYLVEGKIGKKDKGILLKAILAGKNVNDWQTLPESKIKFSILGAVNETVVLYSPNTDLDLMLVDIADVLGRDFNKTKDGKYTAFMIFK